MLISEKSTQLLRNSINSCQESFCSGLFLSARWFILSQIAEKETHLVVLPTREAAEYCSADLYNLIEGDKIFFLPESGKGVERSNYKSSLGVQRTAAIGKLLQRTDDLLIIVTYPSALEEKIPAPERLKNALFSIHPGDRLFGLRLTYVFSEPRRGDIAVFKYPVYEALIDEVNDTKEGRQYLKSAGIKHTNYIKRVIGLPGETVEIRDAKIEWGDTLANPIFKDTDGNLLTFDAIVANMPFSKDKWASGFNPGGDATGKGKKEFKMEASLDKFHRFDWGVPPASKGDWAFLLHMIASMSVKGRIAAVAPHGVLFRGAAEGRIRQRVIEENLLDAVIGLPENLFYGTSIPACILVFKNNRQTNDVLFIDASKKDENGNLRYIKAKNQNELGQKHVDDIVQAYLDRRDVDKFAHVATLDEIRANDYNLNIPRYVDTFEEEELVDIEEVQSNITRLKQEIAEAEAQMDAYLKELGL